MSSADYVSRIEGTHEKTPLQKVVERWRVNSYMPYPLKYEQYTDEQKFAVVLEQLVASSKEHLAMLQICLIAAATFKESKQRALQNWCDAYVEHYSIGDDDVLRSPDEG